MFQYKLLHRTIPTNTFLYKCRLVETELCTFCGETRKTILHLFCDYNIVKNIWLKIYEQLQTRCGGLSGLSGRDILLGIENVDYLYINSILLITKYYIYSCKFKKVVPSFSRVISLLGYKYKIDFFLHQCYLLQSDREFGIDGMKYYFSWERIKEQHGVCVCGGGQKLFFLCFWLLHVLYHIVGIWYG